MLTCTNMVLQARYGLDDLHTSLLSILIYNFTTVYTIYLNLAVLCNDMNFSQNLGIHHRVCILYICDSADMQYVIIQKISQKW